MSTIFIGRWPVFQCTSDCAFRNNSLLPSDVYTWYGRE